MENGASELWEKAECAFQTEIHNATAGWNGKAAPLKAALLKADLGKEDQ